MASRSATRSTTGCASRTNALSYAYDLNGNRQTISYPGEVTATYGHDFADRPQSLSVQVGTDPVQAVVLWSYLRRNRRSSNRHDGAD